MKVAGTLSFSSWVFSARPEEEEEPVRDQLQSSTEGEQMGVTAGRLLTQVGVHDKEVEVLLQVTAVLRHLSPQQVEYGSQQVVAQTEVVAALRGDTEAQSHPQIRLCGQAGGRADTLPVRRVRARRWATGRARPAARSGR